MIVRSLPRWFWGQAYVLLMLAMLFWSGNAIVGRVARDDVPPLMLAFLRWTGSLLIILPFVWRQLRHDAPELIRRWRIVLLLGITGVGIFNTLLYISLHYTTATNSLVLQSIQAPLILLLGILFMGERPGGIRMLGAALSFAGVMVIVTRGEVQALLHLDIGLGEMLVLVASAIWAVYTVWLPRRPQVHSLSFITATFLIGVVMTMPLAAMEYAGGARIVPGAVAVGSVLYVMLLPSLLSFILFNRSIELIGASTAGQALNLMPVAGALLAALILSEPIRPYHLIGMVTILAGLWLFARPGPLAQGSG